MKKLAFVLCILIMAVPLFGCESSDEERQITLISKNYVTLENLIDCVSDIVKAKCLTVPEAEDGREYTFQIEERFLGEDTGEVIVVRTNNHERSTISKVSFLKYRESQDTKSSETEAEETPFVTDVGAIAKRVVFAKGASYSETESRDDHMLSDTVPAYEAPAFPNKSETESVSSEKPDLRVTVEPISYKVGESYYLFLGRKIDVYTERNVYSDDGANLCIPASDVTKSTMYGTTLTDHCYLDELTTEEDLCKYIVTYLEEHPQPDRIPYYGTPYIDSRDMNTVISQAEYVVRVEPLEKDDTFEHSERYSCRVVAVLKGTVTEGEEILVQFKKGTASVGKDCIVALVKAAPGTDLQLYRYAAPDSVYSTWKQNEIEKIIEEGT